jgi:hypothetical protein
VYVKLCSVHECFRARLSPKPWRLNLPRPPFRYPWEDAEQERDYRAWVERYEDVARGHAVCDFIDSIGPGHVRRAVEPILELHDRHAGASGPAALA